MAGERKGITYEAIVKIALEELVRKGKLTGCVFWNEKPDEMTIEPDLTVGPDKNHPTHVFLVTHSGAAGNSHMKFWRNLGELGEAKIRLQKPPLVYSIAFDAVIKEDLKALQASAFDGQLLVGDSPYGAELQQWVESQSLSLPQDAEEKVHALRQALKKTPRARYIARSLERDLAALVQSIHMSLDLLWAMERRRTSGQAPIARVTHLRRGVGKMLLLNGPEDINASGRLAKSVSLDRMESLKAIGLVTESIGGPRVADAELLWAARTVTGDQFRAIAQVRANARVQEWIASLHGLAAIPRQVAFIAAKWSQLRTPLGLMRALEACHAEPNAVAPDLIRAESRSVWLFHLLIEWIKLSDGRRAGYGLNAILKDLDTTLDRAELKRLLGREPIISARRSVELGLTDWHSSASKQQFRFSEDDLARTAILLARRLVSCPAPTNGDVPRFAAAVVQTNLEAKLLCYRHFDPIRILIERALSEAKITGSTLLLKACYAEAATAGGAQLDPRSSGTTVMRVGRTLINWQSASDEGRDHKKKELCGRAAALRYTWDTKKNVFAKRPLTDKLIMIVDGTWRQDDLDALAFAGWDEIFYPDEMDNLVKAIV
jgi:hypothetical protein